MCLQITGRSRFVKKRSHKADGENAEDSKIDLNIQGKGLVLIGDVGFGNAKSGKEWLVKPQSLQFDLGFGNLSLLSQILEEQQQQESTASASQV